MTTRTSMPNSSSRTPALREARAISFSAVAIFVFVLLIWPVLLVFKAAWEGRHSVEPSLTQSEQRVSLALETSKLILLVLAIALPVGVTVSLAVFRSDVPARWLWLPLILLPAL